MAQTGRPRRLQTGTGVLPAPRGAFWWGLGGYILTAIIGFLAVANFEWTKSTYVVDEFLYANRSPFQLWLADILEVIDREDVVAVILLVMGILVTLRRGWLAALGSMFVAGAGWLLIAGIKLLVAQPRPLPFEGPAYKEALSYPSGHVTFVMALTVALCVVLAGSRWRWPSSFSCACSRLPPAGAGSCSACTTPWISWAAFWAACRVRSWCWGRGTGLLRARSG